MSNLGLSNIVFAGHVDHGKSSILGRLLIETGMITFKNMKNIKKQAAAANAKFSYAFLVDRLYGERKKEKTIDTARCLLRIKKISYQLIDVPGHTEYIKNMLSGATRAQMAVLVVDVTEGLKENSRRHASLLSFLGFKRCIVCINKFDLVNYQEKYYRQIEKELLSFLAKTNIVADYIIPVSAWSGDNLAKKSKNMRWYKGPFLLNAFDFLARQQNLEYQIFRFPVQDVYRHKYLVGKVEAGIIKPGEKILFFPSGKASKIKTIKVFDKPNLKTISTGNNVAFTLTNDIRVKPGQIMVKKKEKLFPTVSRFITANIFWVGKKPLSKNKKYLMKIATSKVKVTIKKIFCNMDIFSLKIIKKNVVPKYNLGKCLLFATKPLAFDKFSVIPAMGRFVLIDNGEIVGGGIIL